MKEKIIKKINLPADLNPNWDNLCEYYFQKREFLNYLHQFNPCNQRYYELYINNKFTAGTIVYTLRMNILTFSNIKSTFKVQIIGLPVSVAAPPMIGDPNEFEYVLSELIKMESGVILGLNFLKDHLINKVLNARTLPTIILDLKCGEQEEYESSLRHQYRRRIHRIREKFLNVTPVITDCSVFSEEHYSLYMQIMKKTTTKLETLSLELFRNLPSNFRLTTYYSGKEMLCWHIICQDEEILFFFFGGMNYKLRDQFHSYNNNLLGIVKDAFELNYKIIDFGQTAEVAKTRLGGKLSERRMFFYHKNPLVFFILKILKGLITYSKTRKNPTVFKNQVLVYNRI